MGWSSFLRDRLIANLANGGGNAKSRRGTGRFARASRQHALRHAVEQLETRTLLATASASDSTVFFVAESGEVSELVVFEDTSAVHMRDTGATVAAGAGCEAVSANELLCPKAGLFT